MTQIQNIRVKDSTYPNRLKPLEDRPAELHFLGQPVWNHMPCLAIVGSRNPSSNTVRWLESELTCFLQKTNCCIVSGGAYGIDQTAHRVALMLKRPTIVFVPSGLNRPYPPELKNWYDEIIQCGGALVSHLDNNCEIEKKNFLIRNKWIVCISHAVLVVEAKRRSGTMVTARHAMELGADLGVVPTSPFEAGLGGLDLLKDGAHLIRDHQDILDLGQFPKLLSAESQEQNIRHPTGYSNW